MRYLWLADVLRSAGLRVHEVSGWKTRGADSYGPVRGITCHHTAGSRTSTVEGEINVLLRGSESAPPPIAQLLLARNGDWHVVASGLCYHNKIGWGGPNEGYGNDALLGIEAQHSGGDEPWTQVQYESYIRGVAALVRHQATGWSVTADRVAGHKEHQPGAKSDPTFNMGTFRSQVRTEIANWNREEEDDMATITQADFNTRMDAWWNARMSPSAADNEARTALRVAPWQQEVGRSGISTHNVLFGTLKTTIEATAAAVALITSNLATFEAGEDQDDATKQQLIIDLNTKVAELQAAIAELAALHPGGGPATSEVGP